ncbi:MAG: LysR family transcriptional regulator [Dehalococcoidia bacterium]|nr:LysR family transcriptional regulator [Dehalococcoidia bacterium]
MTRFEPRQKLWLEADGRLVMSDYRLRLLQLVADTGSLAQAAAVMGLSYRRAWGKVKELEANLGFPLVRSEVGGAGGGHTELSGEGRNLLDAYRRFGQRMEEALQAAYREELSPLERCPENPPPGT